MIELFESFNLLSVIYVILITIIVILLGAFAANYVSRQGWLPENELLRDEDKFYVDKELSETVFDYMAVIRAYFQMPGNKYGGALEEVITLSRIDDRSCFRAKDDALSRGDYLGAMIAINLTFLEHNTRARIIEGVKGYRPVVLEKYYNDNE